MICFIIMHFKSVLFYFITVLNFTSSEHGDISKRKCQEYGKAVYIAEESPVLSTHIEENLVAECGIVSVPLIIGGVEAKEMEFPHMAVIGFGTTPDSDLQWSCGGALISENFVLTASHCMKSRDYGPAQKVRFGLTDFNFEDDDFNEDAYQEKLIKDRISHPDYKPPSKYNDIALLRLDEAVEFTQYVRPACLNINSEISVKKATAAGFGKLSNDAQIGSEKLMKVDISIIPRDVCKEYFHPAPFFDDGVVVSMICAGELAGGKDTCQGDSGGPLQTVLQEPYCMYNIIGVTSFGKMCGFAHSPAIYSNVSHYVPWIESVVWPNES